MAETFYTALGVETGADADAIRQAFRERVKQRHPDVSEDPGAPREFRRLTTARDVLTDEAERERYDRLGHASYVERHLETSVWTTDDTGRSRRGRSASGAAPSESRSTGASETTNGRAGGTGTRGQHRASGTGDYDRAAWLGEDWDGPRERRGAGGARDANRRAGGVSSGGTAAGATGEARWQRASEAYRYQPSSVPTEPATVGRAIRRFLASVGPWLVVHAVFVGTAFGTAWYTYASTGIVGRSSLPALAFGVLLVGLVVMLSVLHVVSLVYS